MTRWPEFVGRSEPLARLVAAYRAVAEAPARTGAPATGLVLVTGEAGIGKTVAAAAVRRRGRGQPAPPSPGAPAGTTSRRRPGGRGPRRCAGCWTRGRARRTARCRRRCCRPAARPNRRRQGADPGGTGPAPRRRRPACWPPRRPGSRWSWCSTTSSGATRRRWTWCGSWSAGRGRAGLLLVGALPPRRGRRPRSRRRWPSSRCRPSWSRCRASAEAEVTELVAAVAGAEAASRWGGRPCTPQRRATRSSRASCAGRSPPARTRAACRRPSATSSGAASPRCPRDCTGLLGVAAVAGSALSTDVLGEVPG